MSLPCMGSWEKLDGGRPTGKFDGTNNGIFKIPLLGAAGSGAPEIAKGLRTVYGSNIEKQESGNEYDMDVMSFKNLVRSNAIHTMLSMVNEIESSGVVYSCEERSEDARRVQSYICRKLYPDIPRKIWMSFKRLWEDPSFVRCAQHTTKEELLNKAEYYFNSIDRLSSETYVPSTYDVTTCRSKLNCISETRLREYLWLLEAGPVFNKRDIKNVLQYFGKNTVVIFCVDVSSYDHLEDDGKTNRLLKTVDNYKTVVNHGFDTIVVFTNKYDFERKLKHTELKICFTDYSGRNTFKEAIPFIKNKFVNLLSKRQDMTYFVLEKYHLNGSDAIKMKKALKGFVSQILAKQMKLL